MVNFALVYPFSREVLARQSCAVVFLDVNAPEEKNRVAILIRLATSDERNRQL